MESNLINVKQCTKCKENKYLNEFYKHKNHKDGLNSSCKVCTNIAVKKYSETPKGKFIKAISQAKYRKTKKGKDTQSNSDKKRRQRPEVKEINAIRRKIYDSTPEAKIMKSHSAKRYLKTVKGKRKHLERCARWVKNNPGKANAQTAKRQAIKLRATPSWLSKKQLKDIEEFYILAKEIQWLSEEPLQVDHIVPLQGESISGLHVPWNLQILPQSMNASKGNKLISNL